MVPGGRGCFVSSERERVSHAQHMEQLTPLYDIGQPDGLVLIGG